MNADTVIIDDPIVDSGLCTACQKRPANSKQLKGVCQYCARKAKTIIEKATTPKPPEPPKLRADMIDGRKLVPGVRMKINDVIVTVFSAGEDFLRVGLIGKGSFKQSSRGTILHFGKEQKNYMVDMVQKKEMLLRVLNVEGFLNAKKN